MVRVYSSSTLDAQKTEYHTPGNSILGNSDGAPPVAEKTITIDDLLISSAFVSSSMKHWLTMN